MKITDKAKKRLIIAGFGTVCVVLVIAIASQFKTEAPKDVSFEPSSTVSNTVSPSSENMTLSTVPTKTPEISLIESTPTQVADAGKSTGTVQSIQEEVTKPSEPSQETKIDPTKKPDGEKVTTVTPVEHDKVTKPENDTPSSSSTTKSGDKNEKGQIWVPGFGWVNDSSPNVGTKVGDDTDELTGNKVGSMD